MNESDFFNRIASRLGRTAPLIEAPVREVVGAPQFWREYELAPHERVRRFVEELEKLGGQTAVYETLEELQRGFADLLRELSPHRIGTWGDGGSLASFSIEELLADYLTIPWEPQRDRAELITDFAAADIGVTGADYAIAYTGTVVLLSSPHKGRSVSLLPTVHIVLLRASQIRTRMGEVLDEIAASSGDPTQMPSSINFITGPSRSSDIENDLSIGVHGPVAEYVLLLNDC